MNVWGGVGSYESCSYRSQRFANCFLAQDLIEIKPAHLIDVNRQLEACAVRNKIRPPALRSYHLAAIVIPDTAESAANLVPCPTTSESKVESVLIR